MKLARFERRDGVVSWGIVQQDRVLDCGAVMRGFADLDAVFAAEAVQSLNEASALAPVLAMEDIRLLMPLTRPGKILCIGLNYHAHIEEFGLTPTEHPPIFTRYLSSMVGPNEDLVAPKASSQFDYEAELAFVFGKVADHVPASQAFDYIGGYTAFHDGSIRDFQSHTSQFWPGKNFSRTGSFGPWIVTPDEFGDPDASHLRLILNGVEMQSSPVSDLAIKIPEIIAYITAITPLMPGDIVATGTPSGVGVFRKPPVFMKPGDKVEVEVAGIGVLSNQVIAGG